MEPKYLPLLYVKSHSNGRTSILGEGLTKAHHITMQTRQFPLWVFTVYRGQGSFPKKDEISTAVKKSWENRLLTENNFRTYNNSNDKEGVLKETQNIQNSWKAMCNAETYATIIVSEYPYAHVAMAYPGLPPHFVSVLDAKEKAIQTLGNQVVEQGKFYFIDVNNIYVKFNTDREVAYVNSILLDKEVLPSIENLKNINHEIENEESSSLEKTMATVEKIISEVPSYISFPIPTPDMPTGECMAVSAAMVLGYWDDRGYVNLIDGGGSSYSGTWNVDGWFNLVQEIHNGMPHFDGFLSIHIIDICNSPDHNNNYDFQSISKGYNGIMPDSLPNDWNDYCNEIDNNRPFVYFIHGSVTPAPLSHLFTDHAVAAIGYKKTGNLLSQHWKIVHYNSGLVNDPCYLCEQDMHMSVTRITSVIPGGGHWSGNLTNSTIWSGNVYVDGTISIQNGATLTIYPGTVVNFTGYYSIAVYSDSKIIAEGTQTSPIIFKSATGTTPKSWDSFYVNGSNNSFKYCTFQYGDWALCVPTSSTGNVIQNCTFLNNDQAIRIYYNTGSTIYNCYIHNNRHGLVCYNNTGLTIQSNRIEYNGRDGVFSGGHNVLNLYLNVIQINGQDHVSTCNGLYATTSDVFWLGSTYVFGRNTIRTNYGSEIYADYGSPPPTIYAGQSISGGGNAIFDSTGGYELWNYSSNPTIQAQNNWWGESPPDTSQFSGPKDITNQITSRPNWIGSTIPIGKALVEPTGKDIKEKIQELKEIVRTKSSSPEGDQALKELYTYIRSDYADNQYGEKGQMSAYLEDIRQKQKGSKIGKTALELIIDWRMVERDDKAAIQLSREALQVLSGEERMCVLENLAMLYLNTDQIENAKTCLEECKNKYSQNQAGIQFLEEELASVLKQITLGLRSPKNKSDKPEQNSKPVNVNQYDLSQNYPNPGNPSTMIQFKLPQSEQVVLKVVNLLGEEVKILVDEY